MLNNPFYYPYNNNLQPAQTGFRGYPVSRIEEAQSALPDYQGNLVFYFNQAKNEVYLKKFDTQTGNVQFAIFTQSNQKTNDINEEISTIKTDITKLYSMLEKEVKDAK